MPDRELINSVEDTVFICRKYRDLIRKVRASRFERHTSAPETDCHFRLFLDGRIELQCLSLDPAFPILEDPDRSAPDKKHHLVEGGILVEEIKYRPCVCGRDNKLTVGKSRLIQSADSNNRNKFRTVQRPENGLVVCGIVCDGNKFQNPGRTTITACRRVDHPENPDLAVAINRIVLQAFTRIIRRITESEKVLVRDLGTEHRIKRILKLSGQRRVEKDPLHLVVAKTHGYSLRNAVLVQANRETIDR
ncbi:MAG: hypothetical protein BWY49_00247 [Candidatus Omnitrophica bacterium ADurb.Bin314]|nr:MAG: hypothetical protein BWY49_00247 [Candidatus Omnitrophica bacterium ADurb.Bin314]